MPMIVISVRVMIIVFSLGIIHKSILLISMKFFPFFLIFKILIFIVNPLLPLHILIDVMISFMIICTIFIRRMMKIVMVIFSIIMMMVSIKIFAFTYTSLSITFFMKIKFIIFIM